MDKFGIGPQTSTSELQVQIGQVAIFRHRPPVALAVEFDLIIQEIVTVLQKLFQMCKGCGITG